MKIEELDGLAGTDLIQDTFLFQLLDFDETVALAGLVSKEARKKGEAIIDEGSLGEALYIIEKGRVKVFKGEGDSEEELAVLEKGELFGEMSLIEDVLTSASVVADTDVALLMIKRAEFDSLMNENKDVALKIYKTFCLTLSERLRRTSEELSKLKFKMETQSVGAKGKSAPKSAGRKKTVSKKKGKK
jgi:CRP-like cAMP-binding protein